MAKINIDIKGGKIANTEQYIIGIDLGTSNSLVAYMKEGNAYIIKDKDDDAKLVPSIIQFLDDDQILIGTEAKISAQENADRTIFSVKRLMGKSYQDLYDYQEKLSYQIIEEPDNNKLVKIKVDNRFYTPIQLSAHILSKLKESAEKELNTEVQKAVITVPAYFNDTQRQATRDAGKLAGLDVLRIINEPTAASLAYGIGVDKNTSEKIVVYDLGGGTFDISILHIEDGIFEVLSTHGNSFLGGDDFDNNIIDYWYTQNESLKEQVQKDANLKIQIKLLAEEAKKQLSTIDQYTTQFLNTALSISRNSFNDIISALVMSTVNSCQQALTDAQLSKTDINKIIMVGGSTRIPFVKEQVAAFFEKPVYDEINPDEVVALGAAIQADILAGNNSDFLLLDISPLSLGIETIGGLMDVIIPRNTKVPARFARNYTTSIDGQTNLKVSIYQGERDLIKDNRALGKFILRGIPPMVAGMPKIEIQFILDIDGILTVKAKELRSGVNTAIEIRSAYSLSDEEMGKMLLDSIKNASTDMNLKAIQEAKNEGNQILTATKKFLIQNKSILTEEEINNIGMYAKALKDTIEKEDKDAINNAMKTLNDYSSPLAHRAMDHAIANALKGTEIQ